MIESVNITVGGMKCAGCEGALRQGLLEVIGVSAVKIDRTRKNVSIAFDASASSLGSITDQIRKLGYRVPR